MYDTLSEGKINVVQGNNSARLMRAGCAAAHNGTPTSTPGTRYVLYLSIAGATLHRSGEKRTLQYAHAHRGSKTCMHTRTRTHLAHARGYILRMRVAHLPASQRRSPGILLYLVPGIYSTYRCIPWTLVHSYVQQVLLLVHKQFNIDGNDKVDLTFSDIMA